MYDVPAYVWALVLIGAIGIPATTSVMLYRGALAAGLGRRTATAVTATAAGIGIGYLAGLGPYRPLDITPSTEPLSLLPLALVATVAVPTVIALTSSRSAVCAPATGPSRTEPTTPSQPAAEPPCGGGPASFTTAADTWLTGAQPRQFAREELDMESNWEDAPPNVPGGAYALQGRRRAA